MELAHQAVAANQARNTLKLARQKRREATSVRRSLVAMSPTNRSDILYILCVLRASFTPPLFPLVANNSRNAFLVLSLASKPCSVSLRVKTVPRDLTSEEVMSRNIAKEVAQRRLCSLVAIAPPNGSRHRRLAYLRGNDPDIAPLCMTITKVSALSCLGTNDNRVDRLGEERGDFVNHCRQ
jgi:hypothetical protein